MAGRPARLSGFPVLVRSRSRRRGTQGAAGPARRDEPGWDPGERQAGQEHAGEDPARKDELARLIVQVREARERLARLIASLRAERPDWKEREQRWARWRTETKRRAESNPPAAKIH